MAPLPNDFLSTIGLGVRQRSAASVMFAHNERKPVMTLRLKKGRILLPLISLAALGAVSACCLIPGYQPPGSNNLTTAEAGMPVVTGTVTYRERMMAPEGSVVTVLLQDTSRADAAAINIAEWSEPLVGSVPVAFTLTPETALDPRMTYTVRATLRGPEGDLMFTTDTMNRVPLPASGGTVDMGELVMVKVVAAPSTASTPLTGDWIIESIGGKPTPGPKAPTIAFTDDGQVSGFGGCNRFMGRYEQDGATLDFGPIAMTMMACAAGSANQLEGALGAALDGKATYVVNGDGGLVLTGANGTEVTATPLGGKTVAPAGTTWKVTAMGGVAIVSGSEPEITFKEGGELAGTTGCNRFFGKYTQSGGVLTTSGLGMTKMACPGPRMAQEAAFTGIMSGETNVSLEEPGGKLKVTGANGVSFTAGPVPAVKAALDPAVLRGGAWVVEDINRGGVIDNTHLTLNFAADGKVSGSTNCNTFAGTAEATGTTITFGPLAMTRKACVAPALNRQEQAYTAALSGEMDWTITSDGALELTGAEGRRVLLRR